MTIPGDVRKAVRERVWTAADELDWATMSDPARSRRYEQWTADPAIGGILAHYLDPKRIRVYLKDSVIRPYNISKNGDATRPCRLAGVSPDTKILETYAKPHGRRFVDGRIVCWGSASDWKAVILAAWERGLDAGQSSSTFVVLTAASGFPPHNRGRAGDLAHHLGVGGVLWVET